MASSGAEDSDGDEESVQASSDEESDIHPRQSKVDEVTPAAKKLVKS